MDGVTVTSLETAGRASLDAAEHAAQAVGADHLLPLLDAVAFGATLIFVKQRAAPFDLPRSPWIALVGDDPRLPAPALGPGAFPRQTLRRLLRDAAAALVMASEPIPGLYQVATIPAIARGRNVVIVETRPELEIPWLDLCRRRVAGPLFSGTVEAGQA